MKSTTFKQLGILLTWMMPLLAQAKMGAVDYSWGAQGLEQATTFVGTLMMYTVEILYAVAAIVVCISSLQIYIKMQYHEGEITKQVVMLVGGILFMLAGNTVMPAFFGYQEMTFSH